MSGGLRWSGRGLKNFQGARNQGHRQKNFQVGQRKKTEKLQKIALLTLFQGG